MLIHHLNLNSFLIYFIFRLFIYIISTGTWSRCLQPLKHLIVEPKEYKYRQRYAHIKVFAYGNPGLLQQIMAKLKGIRIAFYCNRSMCSCDGVIWIRYISCVQDAFA